MQRRCNSCGLDRDPLHWFGSEENPDTCRECLFNNDRAATMAICFVGMIAAAVTPSRQAKQEYNPLWLTRSAITVKKVIRKVAETVSPKVAADARPKDEAPVCEQKWLLRQPEKCANCNQGNMLFSEFSKDLNLTVHSNLCKVCLLIRNRYLDNLAKQAARKIDDKKRVESIRFKAIEKTRVERYFIRCMSCKVERDPTKVAVVGAVCEFCIDEERAFDFWSIHENHMKYAEKNQVTRMM